MRNKGCASWDLGKRTWGGREKSVGTVWVVADVQDVSMGEGSFWREKLVPELWNFDKLGFNVRLFDETCFLIRIFFVASDLV
nr:hypothetical protein [Tanacetum cinerariifolium]